MLDRIRYCDRQTLETLIKEEALLFLEERRALVYKCIDRK